MSGSDEVYADKRPRVVDFVFDERVAAVFPDMIRRSAPGYETIVALLGVIAERHLPRGATVYDLGCALGASMLSIHSRVAARSVRFIGVDDSAPMLQRCRANLDGVIAADAFELWRCDVRDAAIEDAGMVVLNLTLQFLDPADRLGLLRRIHAGLNAGGVAVLAEKVRFDDDDEGEWQRALHERFKIANGYSALEIAQKRAALERVMTLDSAAVHVARLREAGFAQVFQWFQAFNFCAFVALK